MSVCPGLSEHKLQRCRQEGSLAGISLRSAPFSLWVLIEPRVESDFPSASLLRDIFSETVRATLLLKCTETSQKEKFPLFQKFSCNFFFFHTIMIYIQLVAEKTASLLCLPVLQEKEGWEMLRGWVRVKVSIPARPELSRGRAVGEHGWRCGCCGGSSAGA